MPKTLDIPQRSPEWFKARAGVITASELDSIISPLWKIREGEGVASYCYLKAAERWRGSPLASFTSGAMEQGSILEDEARPALGIMLDNQVEEFGFVTTDDGSAGCSPDGKIDGGNYVELKCPQPPKHVAYLMEQKVPKEYLAQVHGGMYVTGEKAWTFASYCRKFPMLVIEVKRDEEIIDAIHEAIDAAEQRINTIYQKLCKLNGGKP